MINYLLALFLLPLFLPPSDKQPLRKASIEKTAHSISLLVDYHEWLVYLGSAKGQSDNYHHIRKTGLPLPFPRQNELDIYFSKLADEQDSNLLISKIQAQAEFDEIDVPSEDECDC